MRRLEDGNILRPIVWTQLRYKEYDYDTDSPVNSEDIL